MSALFQGSKHAKAYALYRPHFPASVFEEIANFCKSVGNKFQLALDLGCGSGQSTLPFGDHFTRVIGVDPSQAQIDNASKEGPINVEYRVGSAEDMTGFTDSSVDFVGVFQALHWFDTKLFYPEVKRVLAPGGVLAACGYGNVRLDNTEATDIISKYYWKTLTDGGYWDDRRHHINNHYGEFEFPFADFNRKESLLEKAMSLEDFFGYLTSWSAYQTYLKTNTTDPLVQLKQQLCAAYGCENPKTKQVHVSWPIFMLMGSMK